MLSFPVSYGLVITFAFNLTRVGCWLLTRVENAYADQLEMLSWVCVHKSERTVVL